MAYEHVALRRQRVRYNSDNDDNPLKYQLLSGNPPEKRTPTSATIAISNPSGTSVLSAAAMTKSGTMLTYTVDTTTVATWPVSNGYRGDIVVTYDSKTYNRHIVIDVSKYLLHELLGRDQLLAREAQILGAEHAGDEQLGPFIDACQDEIDLKLNAKAFADEQVMSNMVLDTSGLATAARAYILAQWFVGKDEDKANHFANKWLELWSDFSSAIKYDKDGDGLEDTQDGTVQQTLVM